MKREHATGLAMTFLAAFVALTWRNPLTVGVLAQADFQVTSIVGSWTLNRSLSDSPIDRMQGRGGRGGGATGAFGRGGGRGGGGFGGGFPGGGFPGGGSGAQKDPEEAARRQEALRAVLDAPDHLTIVRTDSMLIITTGEGNTTRLSPDGQAIKDESTHTERRTRWENGKLFSVISGSGPKMTEIYSADAGHRELLVVIQVESGRDEQARVLHRLYQADAR